MVFPCCSEMKFRHPATGCGSKPSATNRTAMALAQGSKSQPRARPDMPRCAPEAVSRVRVTPAYISAWARRQESTRSPFAGRAGRSTNWDKRRWTRNLSSEREAVSLKGIRKDCRPPRSTERRSNERRAYEASQAVVDSDDGRKFTELSMNL